MIDRAELWFVIIALGIGSYLAAILVLGAGGEQTAACVAAATSALYGRGDPARAWSRLSFTTQTKHNQGRNPCDWSQRLSHSPSGFGRKTFSLRSLQGPRSWASGSTDCNSGTVGGASLEGCQPEQRAPDSGLKLEPWPHRPRSCPRRPRNSDPSRRRRGSRTAASSGFGKPGDLDVLETGNLAATGWWWNWCMPPELRGNGPVGLDQSRSAISACCWRDFDSLG